MNQHSNPSRINRVTLFDLVSYLENVGWRRRSIRNDRVSLFELIDNQADGIELQIPSNDSFLDTSRRIQDAIHAVSQIEDRSVDELVIDILGYNTDSLAFRLQVAKDVETVPIASASTHVKSIKNLLLFGSCSELVPRAHFEQPLTGALSIIRNFNFCHTFRGSFGFEVVSTIARRDQTLDLFTPPVNRRVVERITRGLMLLNKATNESDPNILIEAYEGALNARMCDALAEIGLDGGVKFDIDIGWARTLAPPDDLKSFRSARIGSKEVEVLKVVSEQLKIVLPHPDKLKGLVVNLHCALDPTKGNAHRTVALKVMHHIHGSLEVKIALGPNEYLLAIDAHARGRTVSITGQLQRKGSVWSLESITEFEVL